MEAKNSYFKRIAQQGNFKNIALSVARRHQKLMYALLQSDDFFEKKVEISTGMCISGYNIILCELCCAYIIHSGINRNMP